MILLVVVLLVNWFYNNIVLYKSQESHIKRAAKGKWDYIAVGSAYCRYGFDFSKTKVKGYNLGFGSQFFYYTDKILRQYSKYCNESCYVLIVCADLVFAEVGKGKYEAHKYYRVLDKENWADEYSFLKDLKFNRFQLLFNPRLLIKCIKFLLGKDSFKEYYTLKENSLDIEGVESAAIARGNDWCNEFNLKDTVNPVEDSSHENTFKQTRQILSDMIDYCLGKGLKPILLVTPVSEQLEKKLSNDFIESVLIKNIEKANTHGVPFLNYFRDERFSDYRLYHNNADFLNSNGRSLFTSVVLSDIEKLKM